jgi:hypothetical protein
MYYCVIYGSVYFSNMWDIIIGYASGLVLLSWSQNSPIHMYSSFIREKVHFQFVGELNFLKFDYV